MALKNEELENIGKKKNAGKYLKKQRNRLRRRLLKDNDYIWNNYYYNGWEY